MEIPFCFDFSMINGNILGVPIFRYLTVCSIFSLFHMRNDVSIADDRSTPDTFAVVNALKERRYVRCLLLNDNIW